MQLTEAQITKLREMAVNSTNETVRTTALKKLTDAGIPLEVPKDGTAEPKTEQPKISKKKTTSKPVRENKPAKPKPKTEKTFKVKGKTYSEEDCAELYKGHQEKKKMAAESSEKSESKQLSTKVADKAVTIVKQIVKDKEVREKMHADPKDTKRYLKQIKTALDSLFTALEKLKGIKISKSKRDRIQAILEEADTE